MVLLSTGVILIRPFDDELGRGAEDKLVEQGAAECGEE